MFLPLKHTSLAFKKHNHEVSHPDASGFPGTKPLIKGYTWFQPKMWQRFTLSGISGRSGPWSCEGSIDAPTKGNRGGEVGVLYSINKTKQKRKQLKGKLLPIQVMEGPVVGTGAGSLSTGERSALLETSQSGTPEQRMAVELPQSFLRDVTSNCHAV